jgi:hypothetical protein
MLTFISLLILFLQAGLQNLPLLSPSSEISVITCGPGEQEAFTAYGHSALRVKDPVQGIDRVYNYGTFDFNTPNFYGKFATGRLDYMLSVSSYSRFIAEYQYEGRWVKEQVLDLPLEKYQELFSFLETNYLPENRYYRYDFFYDNCATRIVDALEEVLDESVVYDTTDYPEATYRDVIRYYQAPFEWTDFGVDIALGSVIDRPMRFRDFFFLPIYVYSGLNDAEWQGKPLVKETRILSNEKEPFGLSHTFTPFVFVMLILGVTFIISVWDLRRKKASVFFDFITFFSAGVVGLLILWLWFGTAHSATAGNYNLLWANPLFLLAAVLLLTPLRKSSWYQSLLLAIAVFVGMAALGSIIIPQSFNTLFPLIMLILLMRLLLRYSVQRQEGV